MSPAGVCAQGVHRRVRLGAHDAGGGDAGAAAHGGYGGAARRLCGGREFDKGRGDDPWVQIKRSARDRTRSIRIRW
eukprot:4977723-Pyramimonas_sp.AAC.1